MRLAAGLFVLAATAFLVAAPFAPAVAGDVVVGDGRLTFSLGPLQGVPVEIAPRVPVASYWQDADGQFLALARATDVDVSWIGKEPGSLQNRISGSTITARTEPAGLGNIQTYFTRPGTNGLYGGDFKGVGFVEVTLTDFGANQTFQVMTADYGYYQITGAELASGLGTLPGSGSGAGANLDVSEPGRGSYTLALDGTRGGGIIMVSMVNYSYVDDASMSLDRMSSSAGAVPAPAPLPALAGTPFGIAAAALFLRRRRASRVPA